MDPFSVSRFFSKWVNSDTKEGEADTKCHPESIVVWAATLICPFSLDAMIARKLFCHSK